MSDVIDFAKAKADADKSRSAHFISLDVYLNSDNSEVWASVTNVGENDIDAGWHNFVADLLRRLAWISDSMAADMGGDDGRPVASVTAFESSRISTRWADDLVVTPEQVDWVRGQMQSGVDEIEAELHLMKTSGIVEVAVRNPSVMEYMKHWEGRAEAAEAKLAACEKYRDAYAECERIGTEAVRDLEAKLAKAVEALGVLIQLAHDCEKELTEELHRQDFCGESLPLTNARATLAELTGESHE